MQETKCTSQIPNGPCDEEASILVVNPPNFMECLHIYLKHIWSLICLKWYRSRGSMVTGICDHHSEFTMVLGKKDWHFADVDALATAVTRKHKAAKFVIDVYEVNAHVVFVHSCEPENIEAIWLMVREEISKHYGFGPVDRPSTAIGGVN